MINELLLSVGMNLNKYMRWNESIPTVNNILKLHEKNYI